MRYESPSGRGWLRRFAIEFCLVVALLVVLSLLIHLFDLDLRASNLFARPDELPNWWGKENLFLDALYDYGVWPADLLAIGALIALIVSIFRSVLRRYRRTYIFLVLVLALGPGLLINMVLKEHWGRPRPREIVEFGGPKTFLVVGERGIPGNGASFPSGHASMGFYFLCLYVLWRGRRPRAARWGMVGGLAGGALMGFQRMAVGAHFLSDVVWSGGVVYLTALVLDMALPREGDEPGVRRIATPVALAVVGAGTIAIALFGTPKYLESEERYGPLERGAEVRVSSILNGIETRLGQSTIQTDGSVLSILTRVRAYGYFDSELTTVFESREVGDTLEAKLLILPQGPFSSLRPEFTTCIEAGGTAKP